MALKEDVIELYSKTSCNVRPDIYESLKKAESIEQDKTAKETLRNIISNIDLAQKCKRPVCQDTGTPYFYISCPKTTDKKEIDAIIREATEKATDEIPLRPNAYDPITGKCLGNIPVIHHIENKENTTEQNTPKITLMLKGGGSENITRTYMLPDTSLNAHRNLDGVKKCIIDAIFRAQGKGCPPYIIGAAIGGNLEDVAGASKKNLMIPIGEKNNIEELDRLEKETLEAINTLGIGPLGFGGDTTALSVKISSAPRHPATYFIGVSISCWCMRSGSLD